MQLEKNHHKYEDRRGAHIDLVADTSESADMARGNKEEASGDSSQQSPI